MEKMPRFFLKIFRSDKPPSGVHTLRFVCALGGLASVAALAARIVAGAPFFMIPVFVLFAGLLFLCAQRVERVTAVTSLVLYGLGLVFLPVLYFTGGGPASGIAAYFALVMMLDFLLLKGKTRAGALASSSAATIFCYCAKLFWGWGTLPQGDSSPFRLFVDNIASILIAGFFMGFVILFQNKVYLEEKKKASSAETDILRTEALLTMVNRAAALLLTAEPDRFEGALIESMENMGERLDIDRVYIWHATERNGTPVYKQLYGWLAPHEDGARTMESIFGAGVIPRLPEWDDRIFSKREYIAEPVDNFNGDIRSQMASCGIRAIMAFPVVLQDQYWGFVSFENCHSESLCSEREAAILQSGSLLLANAVERNENMRAMSERFTQQQLMSNISKRFLSREPLGDLIRDTLMRMGKFLNVVRVLIAVFEKNSEVSRPQYFWFSDPQYAPNVSQKGFSSILRTLFPRYQSEDGASASIYCDNTLTYEEGRLRLFHDQGGIQALICAPLYVDGELWGAMSIEEHERFRRWSESDAQLVGTVSSTISLAVARDIMEKERAAALEQAIQASRAKSDFLSAMSHEMRTPMNAVIGMTTIGRSAPAIEKKDDAFDKINDASRHLLGVINDILDMSKIEANMLELSPVCFHFEDMLQNMVNVIISRADERRQQIFVDIDPHIPRALVGDDQRLAQVITNLLSNAVKFTPEEGRIHLAARLLSEENEQVFLQISVADTGIGITDEQKQRLFRSFEQAESGTSRKYGGTGLGLAISKRIVELMGGEIWVESVPGQGSKFTFTAAVTRGAEEPQRLLSGTAWSNIRIFAVDDEPEIRQFFLSLSESLGISCRVAGSAEEASSLLAEGEHYDVFFIDWKLPLMNGIELARQIRAEATQPFVAILFSSVDWNLIEDDARSAGVDKFLPKPLFPSTVVDVINGCLGLARATERPQRTPDLSDLSGHTILLAEDIEINREIVLALLAPSGLIIECAENGALALQMFMDAPDKYDMIFMDVMMPEVDGYEATRRIRALDLPRARNIPVVAMTANVFREDVERCLEAGMNAHIGKPIDLGEVLDALKKYLP